jgi:hypothetical protein
VRLAAENDRFGGTTSSGRVSATQLVVTRNWQSAFRDDELGCGAPIPGKPPPG